MDSHIDRALQWLEEASLWLEEAGLLAAKVVATAVLLPLSLFLPGPDLLVARIWGKDLKDSQGKGG